MSDDTCAMKKKVNCDQVSILMGILERFQKFPAIGYGSRTREALHLATLLEIMDILGYEFEDTDASGNALSRFSEFDELRGID